MSHLAEPRLLTRRATVAYTFKVYADATEASNVARNCIIDLDPTKRMPYYLLLYARGDRMPDFSNYVVLRDLGELDAGRARTFSRNSPLGAPKWLGKGPADLGLRGPPQFKVESANSVEALLRLLTPENRALLALIRDSKPRSLAELAKLLCRATPNVTRTIGKLVAAGFVEVKVLRHRSFHRENQRRPIAAHSMMRS